MLVLACRVASLLSYKSKKSELKQASDGRESGDYSHSIPSKKGGYNIHNRLWNGVLQIWVYPI